jgi:pilus assembly protein CpaB
MNPARLAIITVALVAAVVLALFVHSMFGRPKTPAPVAAAAPAPVMTRVLVARTNLGVGERLAADNMTWQDWPATTLNVAYITDGAARAVPTGLEAAANHAKATVTDIATNGGPKLLAMVGAVVKDPIYAGEPITASKIIRSGDTSYMAVRLPEGMRAVALPLTSESGAGGFIQPGDRVDVFSTHSDQSQSGPSKMITDTVLSNALVLAVGGVTESPKNTAPAGGATITLQVPVADVTAVARARNQGNLTLVLRSYADIGGRTSGPVAGQSVRLFKGGAPAQTEVVQ